MKYKVWDKQESIVMSNGIIYTAEKWIQLHPIADTVKTVCGGGVATGKYFYIFDDFIQEYEERGVDFTDCITDQDYLDAIEEYQKIDDEDNLIRLADALEDLVVLNMPDIEEEE